MVYFIAFSIHEREFVVYREVFGEGVGSSKGTNDEDV